MPTAVGSGPGEPSEDPEWLVLIPPLPEDEAVAAWNAWQRSPDPSVPLDQVTIDVFRDDDDQELRRYRVRRSALRA